MWLLLAFIAVPMIEIALFIQVGGWIGLWPTLAIVVFTAVIGSGLMRAQGALALRNVQQSFSDLRDPTEPLAHGAMILIAGVLLLTPGFFTDTLGLSFLLPPVRAAVIRYVRARVTVASFSVGSTGSQRPRDPGVIDGEFTEVDDDFPIDVPSKKPTHRPSGWTKH